MSLTYNPSLAKVMVDPHAKYKDQMSNGSAVRALTDRWTDGRYQVHYLPASRLINTVNSLRLQANIPSAVLTQIKLECTCSVLKVNMQCIVLVKDLLTY